MDWCEIRYIFSAGGRIYIYIPISFGDQLITLITGVEGQPAIRSEIGDAVVGILTPDTLPGRPTSQ